MTAPVPVSTRVDRAWNRGYQSGLADGKRVAVIASLVAAYTVLRRHRINPLVAAAWAVALGAVAVVTILPVVAVYFGARALVRHARNRTIVPAFVSTDRMTELVPGEGGDDDF